MVSDSVLGEACLVSRVCVVHAASRSSGGCASCSDQHPSWALHTHSCPTVLHASL